MPGGLRGVIALDGPSGTGKTTISRKLAALLGAAYLDTGAMYRTVTLAVLRDDVDPDNHVEVAAVAERIDLEIGTDPSGPFATLDGADVGAEIRKSAVDDAVSAVSSIPRVRAMLVDLQRALVERSLGSVGGIVVEGRDIGTVVLPDAGLKIYLTATADIRAHRRNAQNSAAGRESTVDDAHSSVQRRDQLDSSRQTSPLRVAADAVEVDTSELTIDQVLVALTELANQRRMLNGSNAEVAP